MSLTESQSVRNATVRDHALKAVVLISLYAVVAFSAAHAKRTNSMTPLAAIDTADRAARASLFSNPFDSISTAKAELPRAAAEQAPARTPNDASEEPDLRIRYFDGRACRPVKTVWMKVTAYSPDHRSCGEWADGYTASMKSVWTNAMKLVAADPKVLPIGSIISVPGYSDSEIVPVLDVGGAIKGARLDVLYPSHRIARKWGVQTLPITVWEYIDDED